MVNDMNKNEILELVQDRLNAVTKIVDKTHPGDCSLIIYVDNKKNTMREYMHAETLFVAQAGVRLHVDLWVTAIKDKIAKPDINLDLAFKICQNNIIAGIHENLGDKGVEIYKKLIKEYAEKIES